jgi:rhodanese-related sulfurtransferase
MQIERSQPRENSCMVPQTGDDGMVRVDPTWGSVQPIELAAGVRTIGELELLEHLSRDLPVIDTRQPDFLDDATIPGARRVPHEEILQHVDELDAAKPAVFFCNGPQCKATPDAIRTLLEHGYPAGSILYYRGGMHDWMTLGYPTA